MELGERNKPLGEVLAGRRRLEQDRASLVDLVREADVVDGDLALAAAATKAVAAGAADRERNRVQLDLVRVQLVLGLALDALDLEERLAAAADPERGLTDEVRAVGARGTGPARSSRSARHAWRTLRALLV